MTLDITGGAVFIDEADVELVSRLRWHVNSNGYAVWRGVKDGKKQTIRMHRLIAGTPDGMATDHLNHDRLDNRRSNLRVCTHAENIRNVRGEKGYCWDASKGKWLVRFHNQFYGRYDTEEKARRAYQLASSGVEYQKRERRKLYYLPVGVGRLHGSNRFNAKFVHKGIKHYLGTFDTIEEATKCLQDKKMEICQ